MGLGPKQKFLILIPILIIFVIVGGFFYYRISEKHRHEFKVTFLNIGQGDSALINFNNGEKMLVDCGSNSIVLSRLGQALPFYDRTIDYVLATHPDLDHYGGCGDVVKHYHVKEIITNGHSKPNDPYWQEWNRTMQASGAVLKVINGPETWHIASATLQFFSPDNSLKVSVGPSDSNNYSVVFKLTNPGQQSFLFTGDMEFPLEDALLARYCSSTSPVSTTQELEIARVGACPALQADVLKVGHHGSSGSSGTDFLAAVAPKTAVILVGQNHYGHPSLRVIRKLERVGTTVLRTDQIGDIVVR